MNKYENLDKVINELDTHSKNIGLVSKFKEDIVAFNNNLNELNHLIANNHNVVVNSVSVYDEEIKKLQVNIQKYMNSANSFLEDQNVAITHINKFISDYHVIVENIIKSNIITSEDTLIKRLTRVYEDLNNELIKFNKNLTEMFGEQEKLLYDLLKNLKIEKEENQVYKRKLDKKINYAYILITLLLISNFLMIYLLLK